jgi:excisionase family DNA binding protein
MLNTREAARFLRVSEASVRRWSDAGLLKAQRVGRRRERRFTEADLTTFLEEGPAAHGQGEGGVRVGGVNVPLHGHFATFYDGDEARLRLTGPFLADGLRAGQPCFLAASGAVLDDYLRTLAVSPGVDVEAALAAGRLVIVGGPGTTVASAIHFWEQAMGRAVASAPAVMRVVGEMTCEREIFASVAEMMSYEIAFNTIAARFPSVTLCAYDVREFDGQTIFDAVRAHPDLFDVRLGSFLN